MKTIIKVILHLLVETVIMLILATLGYILVKSLGLVSYTESNPCIVYKGEERRTCEWMAFGDKDF